MIPPTVYVQRPVQGICYKATLGLNLLLAFNQIGDYNGLGKLFIE